MTTEDLSPEELVAAEYNRVRGRVCGLIESWGFDERRERAMISTFKQLTYDSEKVIKQLIEDLR